MPHAVTCDLPEFLPLAPHALSAAGGAEGSTPNRARAEDRSLLFVPDVRVVEGAGGQQLVRAPGMALPGHLVDRSSPSRSAPESSLSTAAPPPAHRARAVRGDGTLLDVALPGPVGALDTARPHKPTGFPAAVFVYGTLMRGEEREAAVSAQLPGVQAEPGSVGGALVHLGAWPGLIGGPGAVEGELFATDDHAALLRLLAVLDPIEDFEGYDAEPTEYVRVVLPVRTETRTRWAWAYRYVGDTRHAIAIPSGRWRDAPRRLAAVRVP